MRKAIASCAAFTPSHADSPPRDVVARAVHRQLKTGAGAYLDARPAVGEAFPERFPGVFAACRAAGIESARRADPGRRLPRTITWCGVATDTDEALTGVPGPLGRGRVRLYRWCMGQTGWPSNSLLEGLVFGRPGGSRRCRTRLRACANAAGSRLLPRLCLQTRSARYAPPWPMQAGVGTRRRGACPPA